MQCRLIFWLFSVAIIHKASGKPLSSTRLRSSVCALRYSLLQGERCPTLSCFFGKPQPRWGSRKLNITPDFIAGSRGWPIVSYLEKGHRKKITEQKSQKQPPNQPPSCPCFDIRGGISRNGQAGAAACRDWDTMEQGLPPCQCHLQEPPGAHSPRPDGLIGASRANPMPPRWDLSCLSNALEMEGDRGKKKQRTLSLLPVLPTSWPGFCFAFTWKQLGLKHPDPHCPCCQHRVPLS